MPLTPIVKVDLALMKEDLHQVINLLNSGKNSFQLIDLRGAKENKKFHGAEVKDLTKELALVSKAIALIEGAKKKRRFSVPKPEFKFHFHELQRKMANYYYLEIAREVVAAEDPRKYLMQLPKLKMAHDYIKFKLEASEEAKYALLTQYTAVISGWVKRSELQGLLRAIKKISTDIYVRVENKSDEEAPIEFDNTKLFTPFELLSKMYGLPKAREVDPTPFLAMFFLLFFGLAMSDIGYGLLLFGASIVLLEFIDLPAKSKSFFSLLMYAGLATTFFGVLFGSFFGLSVELWPESIRPFMAGLKIFDPFENPMLLFTFSILIGFIQVIFGVLIDFVVKLKHKEYAEAFYDRFLWLALLLQVFAYLNLGYFGVMIPGALNYGILFTLLAIVAAHGRHAKTLLDFIGSGLGSLFQIVRYFGDVLSYSRLFALGLATAIIAMVVNLVGGLVGETVPVIGGFLMAIIIVLGHIFNLFISSFGAFVHSMRLQFIEFFGNFFEGGGREFSPLRFRGEYVEILND